MCSTFRVVEGCHTNLFITEFFSVFLKVEMEKAAHVVTKVNPISDFEFSALAATQLPINWLGEFGVRPR